MKIRAFTIFVLCLISANSFAYQEEIDKFFELFDSGKTTDAVDSIYSTNDWIDNKSDDVHNVKTQMQNIQGLLGQYHGKIKIGVEDLEDRLVHVTYLALFERQPLRLEFVFYRPQNSWVIYSFSFDDEIDEELQGFAREKIVGY